MEKIVYPTPERIIELNILVLNLIHTKKGDQAELLNQARLYQIIEDCETKDGDLHDKAVVLLRGLVQQHHFASGNRRTAFIATKEFLGNNGLPMKIKDDPKNARILLGIRERYYLDDEIKGWIQDGKIKAFER